MRHQQPPQFLDHIRKPAGKIPPPQAYVERAERLLHQPATVWRDTHPTSVFKRRLLCVRVSFVPRRNKDCQSCSVNGK